MQGVLKKYNLQIKKKYGQNFLLDENILNKIISCGSLSAEDTVIEVGPGIGTMSQGIAPLVNRLFLIEIDRTLIPVLDDTLGEYENIIIVNRDVLKIDWQEFTREYNIEGSVKLLANLPYYITTPIIMSFLESELEIENMTLMMQKEVAQRLTAEPGTKAYGSLTVALNYYGEAEYAFTVPPNVFYPKPNVDSAVVHIRKRKRPGVEVISKEMYFQVVKGAFQLRRKTLVNSLSSQFEKDFIREGLRATGLSENIRGEKLTPEEFALLTNWITEHQ
jgi:16S rRNA (adenine1518-N6/adenine1519-N6)-dimethyltransferase